MIHTISCPYIISKLEEHDLIKEDVIDLIDDSESTNYVYPNDYTNITRTDYDVPSDVFRGYISLVEKPIQKLMEANFLKIGYDMVNIKNWWFQQYKQGSNHGWHVHVDCQWTNVYYVELPEDAPKTQLLNPMNQNEIITLDVKEGDVLTFPSFILHRAPNVESKTRKTIISFNSNCGVSQVKGLYDF